MNLLTAIENWVDARAAKQVRQNLSVDVMRQYGLYEEILRIVTNEVSAQLEASSSTDVDDLASRIDDLECKADDLERGIDDLENQVDTEYVHTSTLDERLEDHEVDYDGIQDRIETKIRHILAEATISIDL